MPARLSLAVLAFTVLALEVRAQPTSSFALLLEPAEAADAVFSDAVALDESGNLFLSGAFRGDIDLDPASGPRPGVDAFTSEGVRSDAFLAAYAADGAFRWAAWIDSDSEAQSPTVLGLATDGARLYVGGMFGTSVDLDADGGAAPLTATGSCPPISDPCSPFLAAYDAATGALVWARTFSADKLYQVRDLSLVTDGERVYPGMNSGGGTGFAAYDAATGDPVWSFALSDDLTNAGAEALALSSGRLYVSGAFKGTVDFDPGPGTALRTAADPTTALDADDPYIAAYDAATGAYLWVDQLVTSRRGDRPSDVWEIAADGDRVYATGRLNLLGDEPGSIDLDPSAGEAILEGTDDVFLAAYDAATGAYLWGNHLVGTDPLGSVGAVVGIAGGHLVLSAAFGSSPDASLDLDPSDAEALVEAGDQRAWFATYDVETGALLDGSTYGGDAASRMELATSGRRFALTNWFSGPADLDPTPLGVIEQTPTHERAVFVISLESPPSVATEPTPPASARLRVVPNPSAGRAVVRLAAGVRQRVAVFDALGRRVADLGEVAGEAELPALAPGLYLVRTDGGAAVPVTVVR